MVEYLKYNPGNFSPEKFLRPPTVKAWPELDYLSRSLEKDLRGFGIFERKNSLKIGSEFEILLLSKDTIPSDTVDHDDNPNYSLEHLTEVRKMFYDSETFSLGNSDSFWDKGEKIGRLSYEYRISPQNVSGYHKAVDMLRVFVSESAKKYNILPIVLSQHIHLSLSKIGVFGGGNRFECKDPKFHIETRDAFSHVLSFVLLPEEYFGADIQEFNFIRTKRHKSDIGSSWHSHPEYRLLSSEYACDPTLNLTLALRALDLSINKLDKNLRCQPKQDYTEEVQRASNDPCLKSFFGNSTLQQLCAITIQYPHVSSGKITIDQLH